MSSPQRGAHAEDASVDLAHFTEVGWQLGRWIDVGNWQKQR